METIKVGELKSNFSHVLQRVQAGEKIIISFGKKGKKVAMLVPYQEKKQNFQRPLGLLKGKARFKINEGFHMSDEELLSS